MKGHKDHERKGRATGGRDDAEEDVKDKPEARTDAKKIDAEAEERKSGGRAARKSGGMAGKKHVGPPEGDTAKARADRKPRKSGGSATSNPFSSARAGTPAPGRKVMDME